jgi:hypothetical protein
MLKKMMMKEKVMMEEIHEGEYVNVMEDSMVHWRISDSIYL